MKYRSEIDGLRALAVLPVIFFHAGFEFFSGGFIGVDVFLVISGYLITTIIISEMSEDKFSILNFYERRARRILPALFFVMFLSLPFAWFWLAPNDLQDFGQSLIATSTFSSNILFWLESGYFDTAAELKPLLHTWSLAVEEQYYILFPLFLLLTWRLGLKWIIAILIIVFMISLGLANWGAYNKPNAAFYLLPTRGWELLIGVFLALYINNKSYLKSHLLNQLFSLLGFGMIAYAIIIFDESTPFPSFYTLIPVIGTALLILSAVPKTLTHRLLSFSPLVKVGLISYSAYLWHQPIFAFARHRLLVEISDYLLIILCCFSLIMAYISWRWVESPFRNKNRISKSTVLTFALFGIIFYSLVGFGLHKESGLPQRVNFEEELIRSFDRPSADECFDIPFNHINDKWGCYLGASNANIDYILFGDSHSLSLKELVDDIGKKNNLSIFYTGSSGCIPFLGIHINRKDQYKNNCYLLNNRVARFANNNDIKGIILSSKWAYYTNDVYDRSSFQFISNSEQGPYSIEESINSFRNGLDLTAQKYLASNIPIHIISQPPHQLKNPESLYFLVKKGLGSIENLSVKQEDFGNLEKITKDIFMKKLDDINYHYIFDIFCQNFVCSFGTHTHSYYYDDNHLSKFGAEKLRETIKEIFLLN
jgi:peptidoglycan/LPS O-acetylase OafA/YrhL